MLKTTLLSIAALCSSAFAQFVPLNLAPLYNVDRRTSCCESAQYPLGDATYMGVPFFLGPTSGNNAILMSGTNPVTVDIPVARSGVQRVRTLLNTAWGQPGPNSYLRVEFHGTDGSIYGINLIGGQHIRDHGPAFTQNFDPNPPTCTRNVWTSTGGSVRADMQTFALPAAIRANGLAFIRFIDTGANGFQRGFLFAITLDERICEANVNDDCIVDFFDYLDFVARFADNDPEADFNGDGVIDFFDYLDYVAAFANGC